MLTEEKIRHLAQFYEEQAKGNNFPQYWGLKAEALRYVLEEDGEAWRHLSVAGAYYASVLLDTGKEDQTHSVTITWYKQDGYKYYETLGWYVTNPDPARAWTLVAHAGALRDAFGDGWFKATRGRIASQWYDVVTTMPVDFTPGRVYERQ